MNLNLRLLIMGSTLLRDLLNLFAVIFATSSVTLGTARHPSEQ